MLSQGTDQDLRIVGNSQVRRRGRSSLNRQDSMCKVPEAGSSVLSAEPGGKPEWREPESRWGWKSKPGRSRHRPSQSTAKTLSSPKE